MPELSEELTAALDELLNEQRELVRHAEMDAESAQDVCNATGQRIAQENLRAHQARLEVLELAEQTLKGDADASRDRARTPVFHVRSPA